VPGNFIPASDLPLVVGIWAAMIVKIAKDSGHDVDSNYILKVLASGTAEAAAYWAGGKVFTWLLNVIPVAGPAGYIMINASLNALFTLRLGKHAAKPFDDPNNNIDEILLEGFRDLTFLFSKLPSKGEINEIRRVLQDL
jgi:uncharacterized protein (DUF697 family)